MQEDQVDVGLAERVAGLEGLLGRVDQAQVDHLDARAFAASAARDPR